MTDVTAIAARVLAGRPYTEGDVRALAEAVFAAGLFAAQPVASTAKVEVDAGESVALTVAELMERHHLPLPPEYRTSMGVLPESTDLAPQKNAGGGV